MFELRKWYLDCTTSDGAALIGYWATARWGALCVSYAGMLRLPAREGDAEQASTLRAGDEPVQTRDTIAWTCPALDLRARWKSLCTDAKRNLLDSEEGSVRWSCVVPRGECSIDVGGRTLHGLGYVEILEITITPWRLPIRELRWGRWVSPSGSVVWIDWRGHGPLSLVLENGREIAGMVGDDAIDLDDGRRLKIEPGRVVRDGELGVTVLGSIPGLSRLLPPAMLRTREQKWLARATLDGTPGWTIHERVTFGE